MKVDEFVLNATKASGAIQNRITADPVGSGSIGTGIEDVMSNLHTRRAYAIRETSSGVQEFEIKAVAVDPEGVGGGLRVELKRIWTLDSLLMAGIRTVSVVGLVVVATVVGFQMGAGQ